jgi:predicted nucleic acid-binding protein
MKEDSRGDFFKPYLLHRSAALSFVTIAELYFWAYKKSWGTTKITELENRIKNYVVLPYDYLLCQRWALVRDECESKGFMIHQHDCWLAATALKYDCAFATNNYNHFSHINKLSLISPGPAMFQPQQ